MKKSKVIFLALLACAFGASAETTTTYDAELVARGWSRLNASAFGTLGEVQSVSTELDDNGNTLWYVVKMSNGAAIVAPDDGIEPVVAVLPKSNGTLAPNDPLRAILKRDLTQRLAGLNRGGGMRFLAFNAAAVANLSAENAKWNKLRAYGGKLRMVATAAGGTPATIVRWLDGWNSGSTEGDVQTLRFWNQDNSPYYFTNSSIFDLYTPGNSPCGCVATAGASVMHYFRVPSGNVVSRGCSYNGRALTLETKGGDYDWLLVDDLGLQRGTRVDLSADAVDLLGRVAYDCGVGCGMSYGDDGSGSCTFNLMQSFRDVFNVQNAQLVTQSGGDYGWGEEYDIGAENYANIIYNQIRGGAPVVLGIDGHEVVACGYGYDADSTDYTYIFLGWGGSNDAWYALPKIDTKATVEGGWYTSTFIDELITEIAPADNKFVAVVGRLVDADGEPIAGDTIRMSNGEELTTDANGYWGSRVSPDDPCYVVDSIGEEHWYALGASAKATTRRGCASSKLAAAMPDAMTIELLEPSVRVGGEGGAIYGSLTSALKNVAAGQTVEILKPTVFKQSVTVGVDCVIFATNTEASVSCIKHLNDALLTIANGATVTMTNVVFDVEEKTTTVVVEESGTLKIGGTCGLEAVETQRAENLVVVSELLEPLYVDCANASRKDDTFAIGELDYATAAKCANLLLHYSNSRLGGKAADAGGVMFRWAQGVPVPRSEAICQLNGENYRSLDDMFEDFRQNTNSEIVVFGDAAFTNYVQLVTNLTIRGEGESRPALTAAGTSGFRILNGGSLTVSNLVFKGYVDADKSDDYGFIGINGGELTLDDGAVLDGLVGNARRGSGIVDLMSGMVTMREGAGIVNCRAEGGNSGVGYGGAVYVLGTGCMLNLEGGVISNCYASTYGGGVYACGNNRTAGVNISGRLTIADNRSGNNTTADDLYMNTAAALPGLKLTGSAAGGRIGIRYASSTTSGNAEGNAFMTNAVGAASKRTLGAFFNDTDDTLEAAVGNNGMLVWAKKDMSETCSPDKATTHVYYPDGGEAHYPDFATALEHMTNGTVATVEMYKEGQTSELFDADVELPSGCKVVLMSRDADAYEFWRAGDVGLTVAGDASLTLTNILFKHVDHNRATKPYLEVAGGSLTLMSGACVEAGTGNTCRDANGITVYKGGVFTMLPGAKVCDCYSSWNEGKFTPDAKTQYYAVGGGVLIDGASTAYLRGGEITGCHAPRGGGLYACNGSKVCVSGDMKLVGNREISYESGVPGNPSNLLVTDRAELYLDNVLTGDVHVANSVRWRGDTNIVAMVDASWQWGVAALANSAAHFVSDETGDFGVIVTNASETLVVWRGAVRNGVFVSQDTVRDDKTFYVMAGEGAYTPLSMGPLPELDPNAKTADAVKSALTISDLADKSVEDAINGSDDPVDAYERFRKWAMGVESDVDAVVKSDKAGVSYDFGTTKLLTNDPTVEIVELADGDGLEISIVVKDGEDPVEVASKKVAEMLDGSTDVSAWDDNRIELTVTDLTQTTASKVSFKVKPADDAPTAFIRVKR